MIVANRVNLIGLVLVDALCSQFSRCPERGEPIEAVADEIRFQVGGGAANTGSALAQLGLKAKVFGRIGDDSYGRLAIRQLEEKGVDAGGLKVNPVERTTYCFVGVQPDGEHTFVCTYGASHELGLTDIDADELLDTDVLVYQDMGSLPKLDGHAAARLLMAARDRGVMTFADENLGRRRPAGMLGAMLPGIDWFLPSITDLADMLNTSDPDDIVQILRGLGARGIVLKMGADGGLVYEPGMPPVAVPSQATDIVDTTGAGDCFDAGFIAGLMKGLDPVAAAQVGMKTAAACIANVGASTGIPAFSEICT